MVEATLHLPLGSSQDRTVQSLSKSSLIVAAKELLFCELGDGAVILDMRSGVYYGLDAVGTSVWALIQESNSVGNILSSLLNEYDVELEHCEQDLKKLFGEMAALNLIEITYETTP